MRLLRDGHARFEVIHLPQLNAGEVTAMLPPMGDTAPEDREYLGRTIQALADGRAAYVRALGDATGSMSGRGGDPISALTALLTGEGALASWCSHRYELRLHKARGYGALKAILEILAEEEPLTLTEVAQRLHRTPGSTKDYLSWLEDVDLIVSRQKRYSFADPLTRLWVRLHCRPVPPSVDEVAREVQGYAMARLPHAGTGARDGRRRRRRVSQGLGAHRDRLRGLGAQDRDSGPQDLKRVQCRNVRPHALLLSALPLRDSSSARCVSRSSTSRRATAAMSSIARLNAAWFAFDGAVKPLILRTNCIDAARTSSSVAGGSKLNSGLNVPAHRCDPDGLGLRRLGASNRFERQLRALLLGFLLRAADALRDHLVADEHFDVKQLAMVGADFARHAVRRQRPALRLQPFLQPRLVIAAEVIRAAARPRCPTQNSRIRNVRAGSSPPSR